MNPYPSGLSVQDLNPGYGVDSSGKLWFFLTEEDQVYQGKAAYLLMLMDPDSEILTYQSLDKVDHFKLDNDKGMVITHDPYWGHEYLKVYTLNKE